MAIKCFRWGPSDASGPLHSSSSAAEQPSAQLPASAVSSYAGERQDLGSASGKAGALSANREWDCELQWTSKKVNLRLDVSLRATTAAALGQLQSKTSVFVDHTR